MDHPRAMLFDFSGTLMRIEPAERWVRAVAEEGGLALDDGEVEHWARRLIEAGAWYGAYPTHVPEHLAELYEARDLDEPHHRACYTGLIRESGWPWPELVEPLYDRSNAAEAWLPYPDALETVREAKDRGLATAVISNISFDIRPHLKHAGLLDLLDAVVLSYEVGLIKPDPKIFQLACDTLGVDPASAVMVGDHAADGGGSALGVRTFYVDLVPVEERPDALISVLREVTAS
ncbi:HAD superfamily hydrolase (TIGR01509 family) [Catenulispora sp. EB89]|uniref:HAD family hydrolase n=1 Tax=Catenulispora sp. EB89 TaxID=3156257 RepID=UPI003518C76E